MPLNKNNVILDTNILMGCRSPKELIEHYKDFNILVTMGTVRELDRLKMSDGRRGFEARSGLRILREYSDKISIIEDKNIDLNELGTTVDGNIIITAKKDGSTIVTNDLSMSTIATGLGVKSTQYFEPKDQVRKGVHIIEVGEEIRDGENIFLLFALLDDVRDNEYIIVYEFGRMTGVYIKLPLKGGYEEIRKPYIETKFFGNVSALNMDPFQMCAIDSLTRNQITMLTGPAGSGKTFLALAAQWSLVEKGEIDGITIFVNPVKSKNSKEIGFYKGDQVDKLLQEGIGAILAAKLGGGDREVIRAHIETGLISILPISDIRGIEVSSNRSLFITEAQNLDVELMRLALQRAEKCRVFIEGDPGTQLDGWMYEGDNNGMKRAIEVFAGQDFFGNVALENIYRSRIAEIAELM